jgi:hypothetical protein
MADHCPVCDRPLQKRRVASPLPGDIGVCVTCRSPLYFGPAGWRVLEDHELAQLDKHSRVLLEVMMIAKVNA